VPPEMKTELQKSSQGYKAVEGVMDIEDSCWSLITLLWKLDVIRYDTSTIIDDFDSHRYGHQKWLVEMWYQLYMELHGT
jgi:hypothetical protein